MKVQHYKIIMYTGLFSLLLSCKKDFLNVVPQGRQLVTTTADFDKVMNDQGLYLYDFAGGWQQLVLMGDDVAAEERHYNSGGSPGMSQRAFEWQADVFTPTDYDWTMQLYMGNVYTVNKVINGVNESTGGSAEQKSALLAEAKANRAWLYFQFANFFGKPYNQSTASSDPAFPIITSADINATGFTRASVKQVYDFITTDLKDAISKLPLSGKSKVRFNKAAAEALLGKVYLFTGDNINAVAMLNAAIKDNSASSTSAVLYNYNQTFAPDGEFYPVTDYGPTNSPFGGYTNVTESLVAKSFYNGPYNGNGFMNDFIVLSPQARALFDPADLRLNFYAAQFPYQEVNPSGRLSKIGVQLSRFGIQLPELYLLSGEAKARNGDLAGAVADVETLRKNRLPADRAAISGTIASNQNLLIRFIFDERVREFAAEGYRWFDMRRMSVDPLFSGQKFTHLLYADETNNAKTITLDEKRLTLKLPYYIMVGNPQITNNP
ncbi:SusD-like starch-binding protein associating with outer membrane [Mucilaginibacter oryzae]|uniref:SusD-like starch-binding protein associating with outer membrane n=1 Tax=Mucilaginibacter oryzae TaxID=468058 RepID=A0A316H7T6_9SPHI|nr:RagB/SusD family nutrient uptake outer membrane protein [Mucilaginibacter oryzae]PWK77044.1 SusD-like starch-binding protein associating with outer membrane [Mucilaginibacter oryzae]